MTQPTSETTMTENKRTVERYMEGFRKSDHEQILSCLTDDIEWDMPGAFHLVGKAAFDKEVENPAFVGRPTIDVTRMIEENNVVAVAATLAGNACSRGAFARPACGSCR